MGSREVGEDSIDAVSGDVKGVEAPVGDLSESSPECEELDDFDDVEVVLGYMSGAL